MTDMLNMAGVYCIRNAVNGKFYIGSAVSFKKRWETHKSQLRRGVHHSILLQRAWNKYGEAAFEFRVCEYTLPEHAVAVEQVMLDYYKSADPQYGYNISPTAGSTLGVKHSAEAIAKISAWKPSPETRAKISAAQRGRIVSAETRAKISAAKQGVKRSAETCAKMSAARLGKKLSNEHRAKMSAARANMSNETREKMSVSHRGKKQSPEHVAARFAGKLRAKLARASTLLAILA